MRGDSSDSSDASDDDDDDGGGDGGGGAGSVARQLARMTIGLPAERVGHAAHEPGAIEFKEERVAGAEERGRRPTTRRARRGPHRRHARALAALPRAARGAHVAALVDDACAWYTEVGKHEDHSR